MTEPMFRRLLEPGRIGSMTTRNSIKQASTTTLFSRKDGEVTDREIQFFVARARGGVGMVTIGGPSPHPLGRASSGGQIVNYTDESIPGLRKLACAIKDEGARAGFQLLHYGRYAKPSDGRQPVDASGVAPMVARYKQARAMTMEDIE